jgi:TatD DNase family protein
MLDTHNHLQDCLFDSIRADIIDDMRLTGVTRCIVNGTRPSDWIAVADLAQSHPDLIVPSFGLHPWYVSDIANHPDWLTQLTSYLDTFPNAGIGECGLDRTKKHDDIQLQSEIFTAQLTLATERNLPLTIHCVRAWGMLLEILESHPLPARGFLLHSYSGSAELIPRLTKLGAYFSFSGNILHPHQQKTRAIFQKVPPNRLLAETDAPNSRPPDNAINSDIHQLPPHLNHPANLPIIFKQTSTFLDTTKIQDNFDSFFQPH